MYSSECNYIRFFKSTVIPASHFFFFYLDRRRRVACRRGPQHGFEVKVMVKNVPLKRFPCLVPRILGHAPLLWIAGYPMPLDHYRPPGRGYSTKTPLPLIQMAHWLTTDRRVPRKVKVPKQTGKIGIVIFPSCYTTPRSRHRRGVGLGHGIPIKTTTSITAVIIFLAVYYL